MMISKMALPRRTFLRGLGATVALPLLDSMVPAFTAQAATAANAPRRLGYVFIPMGMNPEPWTPKEVGTLSQLSPSLASLTPHLNDVTVVTNLDLENAHTTGNHASSNAAFLSCLRGKRTEGSDYELGTTVDQIAAQQIGRPNRPGGRLRQRLRLRLPEQSVVVVAHLAAADRGGPAGGLRASLWRRRVARTAPG